VSTAFFNLGYQVTSVFRFTALTVQRVGEDNGYDSPSFFMWVEGSLAPVHTMKGIEWE
jgi:hypothetical protein